MSLSEITLGNMTIHIKDQYQPDRELTVAQVNLELQQGTISAQAMAWQPGFEKCLLKKNCG